MDETARELPGDHPVHRLHQPSIQIGREIGRCILLHPNDGTRGPKLVLGVEIPAVVQRKPLPDFLEELREHVSQVREQLGRSVRLVHQVEDACAVAAEQGVQIRGAELRAVADGVAPLGPIDQCLREVHALLKPRMLMIQPLLEGPCPRQPLLLADHAVGQHSNPAPEDGRNETGQRHLDGARPAEHVVFGPFAFGKQLLVIVQPLLRFQHFRRDVVVDFPRLAGGEVLQWVPPDQREPNQGPVRRLPVPERPVPFDLRRIISKSVT